METTDTTECKDLDGELSPEQVEKWRPEDTGRRAQMAEEMRKRWAVGGKGKEAGRAEAPEAESPEAGEPEVVVSLDPALVHASALNTREDPDEKEVRELAASMAAGGQITPAVVRPFPGRPGHYELAAGSRRRAACALNGVPLRAVVRLIPDGEFEDMILADNLQREDPDPEGEARLIGKRLAEGASVGEIAARYGKGETWVRRRVKLLGLVPAMKRCIDGLGFSVEMREFLGDLPAGVQAEVAGDRNNWELRGCDSLKDLKGWMGRRARSLEGCEWLKDPDTAVKGCGAEGCATNDSESLFKSTAKGEDCGRCLNGACFERRLGLARDKVVRGLFPEGLKGVVVFRTKWGREDFEFGGKKVGVLDEWDFKERFTKSRKRTELVGLDVTDPGNVRRCFLEGKVKAGKKAGAAGGGAAGGGAAISREDRVHAKRWRAALDSVLGALESAAQPKVPVLNLVAAFGTRHCSNSRQIGESWEVVAGGPRMEIYEPGHDQREREALPVALWKSVREVLRDRIAQHAMAGIQALTDGGWQAEVGRVARLIGYDLEVEYRRISLEVFPPPKSWGRDVDAVTLEPLTVPGKKVVSKKKAEGGGE